MCGIFGVWHLDGRPVDLAMVRRSTTLLRHRGPDDEGYLLVQVRAGFGVPCGGSDTDPRLNLPTIDEFYSEPFDLAFGFRRLSILDLSAAGHQPMASSNGRFWIVFNGEIYNYLELRTELTSHGYRFRTGTDTEVILAAYQHWGYKCLEHFNGMWAFALWDHNVRSLFIARDRFGVKPLYYTHTDGTFAFASEIKALVGKHGISFQPDDLAIYHYLQSGLMPSPQEGETFFRGVHAVPPGVCITVKPDRIARQRYWELPASPNQGATVEGLQVVEEYRHLFIDSLRLRLRSDVPVGTCLSGGVDSSSIVCVVNELMSQEGLTVEQIGDRQKTFSAVYDTQGKYNERIHIETVLQATGAEANFTVPTLERLRSDIDRVVWHQEEPFQSTSIFAQWCVMSRVRERGVTVLLDGQGADEALGGYRPFVTFLSDLLRNRKLSRALGEARAIQAQTGSRFDTLLARALARQLPTVLTRALRGMRHRSQVELPLLNPDFLTQVGSTPAAECAPWWDHADLQTHLLHQLQESSLPRLMQYEDRNSMAFSVEARVPYMDYRLVEFSFRQAADWRIHEGWTKWILRKSMEGIVPNEIVWRKDKVGFETPEAHWLRQWVNSEPNLFDENSASRAYLNVPVIRSRLNELAASSSYVGPLWRLINLEHWLRVWSAV